MRWDAAGKRLNWGQSPIQGYLGEERENRGLSPIFLLLPAYFARYNCWISVWVRARL